MYSPLDSIRPSRHAQEGTVKANKLQKVYVPFQTGYEIPGSEWFRVAWKSLARNFRNRGEGRFIDLVEKNVMDPDKWCMHDGLGRS